MDLRKTDPEFAEIIDKFMNDEVPNEKGQTLDDKTRYIAITATMLGCGGIDAFKQKIPEILGAGVTPIELKEIIYQATDYLGYARMLPFLIAANEYFEKSGIALPLEKQGTVSADTRLEKGIDAQAEIFGEQMRAAWKAGHINKWLADNCFGDYYTRCGLDLARREMVTFCFLSAQGGCEPQLIAHAKGNMNMGNDKEFLVKVVSQCLPYIGYPRSLNAINCINKAAE